MVEHSIAIIGGGASAALLLSHFSLRPQAGSARVDIYDRTARFAKGVAYSTQYDCHLLNVRAANMSAFQEDKEHFAFWAAPHGYGPLDFVPRKLYGMYLSECLENASKFMACSYIVEDVLTCVKTDPKFSLTTHEGVREYDDVILASGNVRSLRPRVENNVLGYFDDPWSADFETLLRAKKVALIGSGLTAVDMVLALGAKGYNGEILVFSRNALFPEPHVDPVSIPFTLPNGHISPLQMLRLLRGWVVEAAKQGAPWQAVIDALRPHTNPLWQSWDAAERKQFSKCLMTFWNVHRHRMAPQIAAYVENLEKGGQIRMVKSGVRSISPGPTVISTTGNVAVDAVVNCLGYRYEEGRDFVVSGCIGPARFGELFETTAIPEIRSQAHTLAGKILP